MEYIEKLKIWFNQKKKIHTKFRRKFPKKGEVWIIDFGINIGCEQNSKRPALILKTPVKQEKTVIVIPASNTERYSTKKIGTHKFLLHQIRTVDSKRFIRKIEKLKKNDVNNICQNFATFLLE